MHAASALLAVALLVVSALDGVDPAMAAFTRHVHQHGPVKALPEAVARVVRALASERPDAAAERRALPVLTVARFSEPARPASAAVLTPPGRGLREALLNLPPPAA